MTDLDTRVRAMLRERAADIDALPADFADLASLDVLDNDPIHDRQWHQRTGWLIAAVVTAVLAVVGTAVALRTNSHHRSPAATQTPTTRTPVPPTLRRATCTAALPTAWRSALTVGTSRYGASAALPLAVSPDGATMLIARDFGTARDVALVRDGVAKSIYSVPQPDENQVENASLDDTYAVIDLDRSPRNSNGVIPEAGRVLLITLSNGSIKQLDRADYTTTSTGEQGRTIDGSLLWNGHVYWDIRKTYTAATTTIRDYDIATGKTTVAGPGGGWIPRLLADGVTFDPQGSGAIAVPRALPRPVAAATAGRRKFIVTDGQAYAWTTAANQLAWWAPGQTRVTTFALPAYADPQTEAVAGRYLMLDDSRNATGHRLVLDARTGAIAIVPGLQPYILSARGVFVGYEFAGAFKTSATVATRVDTTTLPELSC